MNDFIIEGRKIGVEYPCYLVAEVGVTANGDVKTAKKLVDASKDAGLDAIKFQFIGPEDFMSDKQISYEYTEYDGTKRKENMFDMFMKYKFDAVQMKEIKAYADRVGMTCFATVDYLKGIDPLEAMGVGAYKICSWDTTFYEMIEKIAETGKPAIVDLGPSDLGHLCRIKQIFDERDNPQLAFLHCYHNDLPEDINLRTISYLHKVFPDCAVGFSSSGRKTDLDLLALALNASIIEKRLTLDKTQKGHHHSISLEPKEVKAFVQQIRTAEAALGREGIYPGRGDIEDGEKYLRSLVSTAPIKSGEIFSKKNMAVKRPGDGIQPHYFDFFLGRTTKRDIKADLKLEWEDLIP